MKNKSLKLCVLLLLVAVPAAIGPARAGGERVLRLATTTSTMNSGLLDYLLPGFEKKFGVKVHVIAVGTGKALRLAENGDVALVMVHAPAAELRFVKAGYGVDRRPFMKNDFVIVGPPGDPAGLKKAESLEKALEALRKSRKAVFISRGDDSGTHKKERFLWAGKPPRANYLEIGQSMEAALRMAHEKGAYTLADRGTFLALGKTLDLVVLFEGSPELDNPYAVIATNPARWPKVNRGDARLLMDWLVSPEAQERIGAFKVAGKVLFHPTAAVTKGSVK